MSDSKQLREAKAERAFWEKLGEFYGFGRLSAWSYKVSARFTLNGSSINIEGQLLNALLAHMERPHAN